MEIFRVSYPIDFIPIPMGDACLIIRMDWLSIISAMINCERQVVVVQTLSWGELIIYGEGNKVSLTFYFATRARRYLQHGCLCYLAYVVDTQDEG